MLLMRVLCVVFVAVSLVIALAKPAVIVNLMVMSWSSLAGVFLAPFLYGLFWKRTSKAGIFAGMACGIVTAFVLFPTWGADGVPLAGAITMVVPLIVVPVVSLLTKAPDAALIAKAFGEDAPAVQAPAQSQPAIQ
jgi:Na+/proline symporter